MNIQREQGREKKVAVSVTVTIHEQYKDANQNNNEWMLPLPVNLLHASSPMQQ